MKQKFWIQPKKKDELLIAMMNELAGDCSHIAFEGSELEIKTLDFRETPSMSTGHITPFEHQWGQNGYMVVVPMSRQAVNKILKVILPDDIFIHKIGAIQIERNGQVEFLVGDNFHHECISAGPAITIKFLEVLKQKNIIAEYRVQ